MYILLGLPISILYSEYPGTPRATEFSQYFWVKLIKSFNRIWVPATQQKVGKKGSAKGSFNYKSVLFSLLGTSFRNFSHPGQELKLSLQ